MEAPDKVYVTAQRNRILGASVKPYSEGQEYVCKDLLLKWLEARVYEHNEDKFDDGFNTAIGQVIDKINSL